MPQPNPLSCHAVTPVEMKVSYKWLCEIIPGLDKIPAREIADKLTMSGLEVEEILDQTARFGGVVVGEVVKKEKHPNADKLSVCCVRAGRDQFQVVCGAPNVRAGKKYPFATPGTVLPDGLKIQRARIRGVVSEGMLCSAKELGQSQDHAGLFELDDRLKSGQPFAEALNLNDVILKINVTPNRGDALSHWGVARDVSALTGLAVQFENILPAGGSQRAALPTQKKGDLKLKHRDKQNCSRFTVSQIFGVAAKESPPWLKQRLEVLGLRAINNIVDATNYVMLLTGHPVHAYDARDIAGHVIVIDSLAQSQQFTTLDGVSRQLEEGDLVIGDERGVVGLAGIMGGKNSEIKPDTKDVILEVAHFRPDRIRATAHRLGLSTDSSYRFERFVNPETVLQAHEILRDLILTLAGGEPTAIIDSYPKKFKPVSITLPKPEIKRILGVSVPGEVVRRILAGLACRIKETKGSYEVVPPPARSDLMRPVDLIEEIARVYGLDKIASQMPRLKLRLAEESRASRLKDEIKEFFVQSGFSETIHYSFQDEAFLKKVLRTKQQERWIRLKNPIAQDMAVMRPSLLPHLLLCYKNNHLLSETGLRLFELRSVYTRNRDEIREEAVLAGLLSGSPWGRNRFGLNRKPDFFDAKGLLTGLFERGRISVKEKRTTRWPFHPGQGLVFVHDSGELARVGALNPELLQAIKIKQRLFYFEIAYDILAALYGRDLIRFEPVSPFPRVIRDLSLLVPKSVSFADIMAVIEEAKPDAVETVALFDLYEGDELGNDAKSLAFSFVYQPRERSLTDEEVNAMHFRLVEILKKKLGVALR